MIEKSKPGAFCFEYYTIVDPRKMREALEAIKSSGCVLNKGEFTEDVLGVGAP